MRPPFQPKVIESFAGELRSGNLARTDAGVVLTIWPNGSMAITDDQQHIYIPDELIPKVIAGLNRATAQTRDS